MLLVGGITLLFNSYHVVRREGLRIQTLLPAVFGVFLLGVLVAAVATVFELGTGSSFWNIALAFVLVVIPIAMLVIQLFGFIAYSLVYRHLRVPTSADAVVVLGAGLARSRVTPLLASRIDKGIEALAAANESGGEPVLVMSGGQGSDEDISEAEAMTRYAIDAGVDERRIALEDTSTTTEETCVTAQRYLRASGIRPPPSWWRPVTFTSCALRR